LSDYKLVTINYNEQASLVVKADTEEEARAHVLKTFAYIPGLEIVSVEDAPEEIVAEAIAKTEDAKRILN
jgi:hypothetical protein